MDEKRSLGAQWDPVILRVKRSRLLVPVLCSAMAVMFFILMAFSGETSSQVQPFIQGVSLVGAGVMLLLFLHFLRRLFKPRPVLLITHQGITDLSTPVSIGFVPWKEVGRIRLYSLHGERFVAVDVKNIRERLERESFPAVKKNALRSRLALKQPAMLISLAAVNEDPKDIAAVLQNFQACFAPDPEEAAEKEKEMEREMPSGKMPASAFPCEKVS